MTEEEVRINYRIMLDLVEKKDKKIERLQEDLEYSNYCNEELRKKITNLKYKIKLLEEDNTGERALYHSEREVKEEYKDRIDKALNKLEEIVLYDEYITIHTDFINDTKEILKGKDNV